MLFLTLFTLYLILAFAPLNASSQLALYGQTLKLTYADEPDPVSVKGTMTHYTMVSTFLTGARFDRVHIDIVGPLPPSKGFTYLLTCIDCFTHWPEPTHITTETVAGALSSGWILRFGVPSTVIVDVSSIGSNFLKQKLVANHTHQSMLITPTD